MNKKKVIGIAIITLAMAAGGWVWLDTGAEDKQENVTVRYSAGFELTDTTGDLPVEKTPEQPEPSETPEPAITYVRAYEEEINGSVTYTTVKRQIKITFEWNGTKYMTPAKFIVKPNVKQKVTFYYAEIDDYCTPYEYKTKIITKTFYPGGGGEIAFLKKLEDAIWFPPVTD